ncbi:M16 family metallopeptidase [Actinoalloteichus spitiensis]|uniref:M16 family metallopeptidase n=1 Tax=Actinoalloteichus spitiensis TaxID=252394 RepID=UPI000375FA11|nr:pitrilysin family protein [Actinoalloteichus spitiensis]
MTGQNVESPRRRTAEEIGSTDRGPRPLPGLGTARFAEQPPRIDTMLPNGLRLVAVRQPTVPMVELRLRLPFAGTEREHAARAELLAATLLTGTTRRDRVAMDTDLAMVGADLGAGVDPERLSIAGNALASGLDEFLDVFADAVTGAAYRDHEVDRERDRLVERIGVARSQPGTIAREALQRRRFGDHPLARELPSTEAVRAVDADQVRALHDQLVRPSGGVLVMVGDLDLDAVADQVGERLAGWRPGPATGGLPEVPRIEGGDVLLVDRPGAVQSQIRLSGQAIPRHHPDYPALQLANLVFGGYFSSRLVENIREDKGYTYSAHSTFEFTGDTAGILCEADTASGVTAAALLEIRYELSRMAVAPIAEAEVTAARDYLIGLLLISTASQSGLAANLQNLATAGVSLDWLREHPERLRAVTVEQVSEAARRYLAPTNFTGVVVGDAAVLGEPLRALGDVVLP